MKVDITELLLFFDELMSHTDEKQEFYWLKTLCPSGLIITFIVSIPETRVDIIISNSSNIEIVGLSFKNCSEIRVLDQKRKCLEVLHDNGTKRCFLSLLENLVLEYDG